MISSPTEDSAYKIFNKLFHCRVPYLASLTDEDLDIFGIHYLNDKEYDNYTRNQEIDRYLTINDMVELRKRGVWIKVAKFDDTKTIYEIIIEHLQNWKTLLDNGYRRADVPYEDFEELDKLAREVYPYARSRLDTEVIDSVIRRNAATSSIFSTKDFMATRPNNNNRETINDQVRNDVKDREYVSMLDTFEERRNKHIVHTYDTNGKT